MHTLSTVMKTSSCLVLSMQISLMGCLKMVYMVQEAFGMHKTQVWPPRKHFLIQLQKCCNMSQQNGLRILIIVAILRIVYW